MKEYDYSKWDNHPREMWVWDDDESKKTKRFVVFVNANNNGVLALSEGHSESRWYKHCAGIEQYRRMTNYELAHWLWEGTQVGEFREYTGSLCCHTIHEYDIEDTEESIADNIKIRVNGGEWKEPLVEE